MVIKVNEINEVNEISIEKYRLKEHEIKANKNNMINKRFHKNIRQIY